MASAVGLHRRGARPGTRTRTDIGLSDGPLHWARRACDWRMKKQNGAGWRNRTPTPCLQGRTSATKDKPAGDRRRNRARARGRRNLPRDLTRGLPRKFHKWTVICSASRRRQLHDHRPIFWTFTMSNSAMPRRHRSSRENARAKARELESGFGLSVSSADHQVPPAVWRRAWSPPVSRVFVRDLVRIA